MDSNVVSGLIGFIGALIGAGIGGYFTLKATKDSFAHQKQEAEENEKILIQSLLQAIHDEAETVFDRYQETMGINLENLSEGQGLTLFYPLESDYFPIYNGNTSTIGRIPNNDIRKQIIKTYTLLKGMVDSFRFNNHLLHKYEYSWKLCNETPNEINEQHKIAHYDVLIEYGKTLKEAHKNLKQEIAILLRTLRKQGVLSELEK